MFGRLTTGLKQESGQALPIVLAILVLGAAFIVPAVVYANSALIGQRIAKNSLIDVYSADACNTYAMWQLLIYSSTATVTCNLNGITSTVTITAVPPSNIIDATKGTTVTATLTANHELWAVVNIPTGPTKDAALAYDTSGAPSRVTVPFTTGTVTYYFHNNPTPPVADTGVPTAENSNPWSNLTMTTSAPTATTLYNYDNTGPDGVARDTVTVPGRWVERAAEGTKCAEKVLDGYRYRIVWRSPTISETLSVPPTSSVTISGTVTFRWWWATQDGSALASENFVWWICKYDPNPGYSPTVSVPKQNPDSLLSGPGGSKLTGGSAMWVNPFDLRATARSAKVTSRVDKVSATALRVRSWQWD